MRLPGRSGSTAQSRHRRGQVVSLPGSESAPDRVRVRGSLRGRRPRPRAASVMPGRPRHRPSESAGGSWTHGRLTAPAARRGGLSSRCCRQPECPGPASQPGRHGCACGPSESPPGPASQPLAPRHDRQTRSQRVESESARRTRAPGPVPGPGPELGLNSESESAYRGLRLHGGQTAPKLAC